MHDDDDPNRGFGPLIWVGVLVVLVLLLGLAFAGARFYGLR